MLRTIRRPSNLLHRPTGQSRVRIRGKDHYLGEYGSPESRAKCDELCAERVDRQDVTRATITVDDLAIRSMAHARQHDRKDGKQTSEVLCLQLAIRYVVRLCGETLARSFGPRAFKAVMVEMVKDGHCRASINQHASRLRRGSSGTWRRR